MTFYVEELKAQPPVFKNGGLNANTKKLVCTIKWQNSLAWWYYQRLVV